jgi:hypothetical protein
MNKQEFNKLDIQEQLQYVNNELLKGESLRGISANLTISKTTIRDRFTKIGYKFNTEKRQYIRDTSIVLDNEYKSNTNILRKDKTIENKPITSDEYKHNTNIFHKAKTTDIKAIKKAEYKDNTSIFNVDDKDKIIDMINNYDKLKDMLNWFETQKNIINIQELKVDSDRLLGDVKTTTVRLYSDVWKDFREFMEQYQEYKSMDLVSQALIEFMDKYKK